MVRGLVTKFIEKSPDFNIESHQFDKTIMSAVSISISSKCSWKVFNFGVFESLLLIMEFYCRRHRKQIINRSRTKKCMEFSQFSWICVLAPTWTFVTLQAPRGIGMIKIFKLGTLACKLWTVPDPSNSICHQKQLYFDLQSFCASASCFRSKLSSSLKYMYLCKSIIIRKA